MQPLDVPSSPPCLIQRMLKLFVFIVSMYVGFSAQRTYLLRSFSRIRRLLLLDSPFLAMRTGEERFWSLMKLKLKNRIGREYCIEEQELRTNGSTLDLEGSKERDFCTSWQFFNIDMKQCECFKLTSCLNHDFCGVDKSSSMRSWQKVI